MKKTRGKRWRGKEGGRTIVKEKETRGKGREREEGREGRKEKNSHSGYTISML